MNAVILWGNWVAKALVPLAVLAVGVLVELADKWLEITADGVIDVTEWQYYAIAVITSLGIFLKANGPKPE